MFSGNRLSSAVARNIVSISTAGSIVRARGSSTTRRVSALSSRMSASNGSFLASISSATCSIRRALGTWYGISVITTAQVLKRPSSLCQRARTRNEPRPVS